MIYLEQFFFLADKIITKLGFADTKLSVVLRHQTSESQFPNKQLVNLLGLIFIW